MWFMNMEMNFRILWEWHLLPS